METKKWIHYGWQTFLLCIVVSVSSPVLAKSTLSSSPTKDNARKAKTTKSRSAHIASASKSTSFSRISSKIPSARNEQRSLKNDNQQKVKEKIISSQKAKLVVTPSLQEQRKKDTLSAQPTASRIPYQRRETLRPHDRRQGNDALAPSDRSKQRYITILKETRQQKLEKMVIALPQIRVATRLKQWDRSEPQTRQKSYQVTKKNDRLLSTARQESNARMTPRTATKSLPAAVSAFLPSPNTHNSQSVASSQAVPPSPLPPLVTKESILQDTSQLTSTQGTIAPESSRTEAVVLPSTQAAAVALVEPSNPLAITTKEEQRQKGWSGYSPQKAPFAATVNDEPLGHRINSLFVLPGDEIFLAVIDSQKRADYSIRSTLGPERVLASRRWYWTAPSTTGLYQIKVTNTRSNNGITLNVFVMVPLDRVEDGHLNGYRIGNYPTEPLRQLAMYNRPRGLVEVTPENENTQVSPHFRLRQFLCKQDGGYPKYMILDARLVTTLEHLLEMVNARGYQARTFSIMSGYRTPYYNRAIGNRTTYSRHLWGDAADIFIDEEPKDGKMDDLNQDGVIDAHDADVIYQLIETASEPRIQKIMLGGLARYRETSSHGPFIHVDARGSYARWGLKTLTKGGTMPTQVRFPTNDQSSLPSFWDGQSPNEDLR